MVEEELKGFLAIGKAVEPGSCYSSNAEPTGNKGGLTRVVVFSIGNAVKDQAFDLVLLKSISSAFSII